MGSCSDINDFTLNLKEGTLSFIILNALVERTIVVIVPEKAAGTTQLVKPTSSIRANNIVVLVVKTRQEQNNSDSVGSSGCFQPKRDHE
jgi:hypothetical protein